MEKEYNKIGNIFKFDEKYRNIVGLNEPYNTLKGIIWQGTEKIDGTNIRVHWDGHSIEIAGRTDKSIIPPKLQAYLDSVFKVQEMEYIFEQVFGEKEAYIFGEGYGSGLQTNGDYYVENANETAFIVFDVQIDGYDLDRENTNDIANKLGLKSVPVVFEGTLKEAMEYVGKHQKSTLNNGKHEMEGIVLAPRDVELYDKKKHPIKCKCKYRDMVKAGLVNENGELIGTQIIKNGPVSDSDVVILTFVSRKNGEEKIRVKMLFEPEKPGNEEETYAKLLESYKKEKGADLERDYYLARKEYFHFAWDRDNEPKEPLCGLGWVSEWRLNHEKNKTNNGNAKRNN